MKKKLAFGLAGVSAVLIAGWKLVQSESESAFPASEPASTGGGTSPSPAPGEPAEPVSEKPSKPESATPDSEPVNSGPASESGSVTGQGGSDGPKAASRAELYEIAQKMEIKGRSKMSKAELRRAIEAEG